LMSMRGELFSCLQRLWFPMFSLSVLHHRRLSCSSPSAMLLCDTPPLCRNARIPTPHHMRHLPSSGILCWALLLSKPSDPSISHHVPCHMSTFQSQHYNPMCTSTYVRDAVKRCT
jgi:hypothetical protein